MMQIARACVIALAIGVVPVAQCDELLVNGGFETGDLTGWVPLDNFTFTGVECPGPPGAFEGNCDLFSGPAGTPGTLAQGINTQPGTDYRISFALRSEGGTPSSFLAMFAGVPLLSLTNPAASGYVTRSFVTPATDTTSTLSFSFLNEPSFFHLDAVSVTAAAVPEPASTLLLGAALAALACGRRRTVG